MGSLGKGDENPAYPAAGVEYFFFILEQQLQYLAGIGPWFKL